MFSRYVVYAAVAVLVAALVQLGVALTVYAFSGVHNKIGRGLITPQVDNKIIVQQNVTIQNQTINGDLIIMGQNVRVSNLQVSGNIVAAAQNLVLENVTVGADTFIFGHSVKVADLKGRLTTLFVAENVSITSILTNNLKIYANRVKGYLKAVTVTVRAASVNLGGRAVKAHIYVPDKAVLDIEELRTMQGTKVYYNGALKDIVSGRGSRFLGVAVSRDNRDNIRWFVLWVLNTIVASWGLIYVLGPKTIQEIFTFSKKKHRWLSDSLFGFVFIILFFIVTSILVAVGTLMRFGIQWLPLALFLLGIAVLLLIPAMVPVNILYAVLNSDTIRRLTVFVRFKRLGVYPQVAIMSVALAVLVRLPLVGMIIYTWLYFATVGEFVRWLMHRGAEM